MPFINTMDFERLKPAGCLRLLFFLGLALFCSQPPAAADDADARRLKLYRGMAEGNYIVGNKEGAARGVEEMLKIDPEYPPALRLERRLQQEREAPDGAIETVREALRSRPENADAETHAQYTELSLLHARGLAQQGNIEEAIKELRQLTGQYPDHLEARITLASLYASAERWSSLTGLLDKLKEHPELRDITLYFEGRTALAENRIGTARAKFEEALEHLPDGSRPLRGNLHFHQAVCQHKLDRPEQSADAILKALEADFRPETAREAIDAGEILLRADEAARAIPILEAVALNNIDASAATWSMLGRARQKNKDPASALSAYNQSIALDPANPDVRALRAGILRELGEFAAAADEYRQALRLDPGNPGFLYALGLTRLRQGQLVKAREALGRAARGLPENPDPRLLHALCAYVTGAHDKAGDSLGTYLEMTQSKPNTSARFLEYALTLSGDPKKARNRLRKSAGATNAPESLRHYLVSIEQESARKELLKTATQAVGLSEDARRQICETAFWLARHEAHSGNPEQAEALLRIALRNGSPDYPEWQFARWQLAHHSQ
ncbi:MAG: tetratricopeptide repeat protein [Opitutales bacterium]